MKRSELVSKMLKTLDSVEFKVFMYFYVKKYGEETTIFKQSVHSICGECRISSDRFSRIIDKFGMKGFVDVLKVPDIKSKQKINQYEILF